MKNTIIAGMMLAAVSCTNTPNPSQSGVVPVPRLWVVPEDMSAGLTDTPEIVLQMHTIRAHEALRSLLATVRLVSREGEEAALQVASVENNMHTAPDGTQRPPLAVVRPRAPLREGWYYLALGQPDGWLPGPLLVPSPDGTYGSRLRVGHELLVKRLEICPAYSTRTFSYLDVRFSEPAGPAPASTMLDAVRVFDASGAEAAPARQLERDVAQESASNSPYRDGWFVIFAEELAPIIRVDITDAVRSLSGSLLTPLGPGEAQGPQWAVAPPSPDVRFSATVSWSSLPRYWDVCHLWRP
jgi:hypothetical protein